MDHTKVQPTRRRRIEDDQFGAYSRSDRFGDSSAANGQPIIKAGDLNDSSRYGKSNDYFSFDIKCCWCIGWLCSFCPTVAGK